MWVDNTKLLLLPKKGKVNVKVTFDLDMKYREGLSGLGGHLKTGQSWTGQNRPVERGKVG